MTEEEITIRMKSGDHQAFETLYNCYWSKVYKFAQLYITTSVDISEVVQEVFIKLWETRHVIDEQKRIEGLLFIITRNIIFNHSRRYFNYEAFKITTLQAMTDSYNMEEEIEVADLKKYIDELVTLLPPRQQEVFRLSREQYLSNKEIAEKLSIAEKSVERNMNMALKNLRRNLRLLLLFMSL